MPIFRRSSTRLFKRLLRRHVALRHSEWKYATYSQGGEARFGAIVGPFCNLPADLLEVELAHARFIQQYPAESRQISEVFAKMYGRVASLAYSHIKHLDED